MENSILSNIVREVDAIRGYISQPVMDNVDFIHDEISHIIKLAGQLVYKFDTNEDIERETQYLINAIESVSQGKVIVSGGENGN